MAYSCSKAALDRYVRDMVPTLKDTNVLMNLMDQGWLRTDLGGDQAPNSPDAVLPGAMVPVLRDEKTPRLRSRGFLLVGTTVLSCLCSASACRSQFLF